MADRTVTLTPDELWFVVNELQTHGHGQDGGDYEPECPTCSAADKLKAARDAAGVAVDARGVIVGIADQPLADAARVLAEFAKTAPGRLPQRVQDAIAVATAGVKGLDDGR